MAKVGGAYVTFRVVVCNEIDAEEFVRSIEQLQEMANDYPFLDLTEIADRLVRIYESLRLEHVPD